MGCQNAKSSQHSSPSLKQAQNPSDLKMVAKRANQPKKMRTSTTNSPSDIQFYIQSMSANIQLSSKESQSIPALISISTKDLENTVQTRPNIDLICVIDRSGSMSGEKMRLVQETLKFLIETLGDNDRLALVVFDDQSQTIKPLEIVEKQECSKIINQISIGGSTNIQSGLEKALEILKNRTFKNEATSVFLLSDGIDDYGKKAKDNIKKMFESQKINDPFTIQTFGFGNDHDADLMSSIADLKDGNFYYIEQLNTIDEVFADAMGALFSVVAENIQMEVQVNKQNPIFADINISQAYGDFWKFDAKTNTYSINLQQIITGVSKDFIVELEIPPILKVLTDASKQYPLLKAKLSYNFVNSSQKIEKEAQLDMTFFNEGENLPETKINEDVEANYLRVQTALAIKKAQEEADKENYDQGKMILRQMNAKISKCTVSTQNKVSNQVSDLYEIEEACNKVQYESVGNKKMKCISRQQMQQRSKGTDENQFQNNMQKQLMNIRKTTK